MVQFVNKLHHIGANHITGTTSDFKMDVINPLTNSPCHYKKKGVEKGMENLETDFMV